MNLEQRTAALLELVEQYRARRFAELLEPAQAEARQVVRAALAEARRRVHTAIVEERKRYATRGERGGSGAGHGPSPVPAAPRGATPRTRPGTNCARRLVARWDAAPTRAQWVRAYLQRALRSVPCASGGWRIQTHPAWTDGERAHWLEQLRIDGVAQVAFETAAAISAGFRVVSGNNILDATIEGLLADRTQLEGKSAALPATGTTMTSRDADSGSRARDPLDQRPGAARARRRTLPAARGDPRRPGRPAGGSDPTERGRDRRAGVRGHDRPAARRGGARHREPARHPGGSGPARQHLRRPAAAAAARGRVELPLRPDGASGRAAGPRRALRRRAVAARTPAARIAAAERRRARCVDRGRGRSDRRCHGAAHRDRRAAQRTRSRSATSGRCARRVRCAPA